MEIFLNFSVSGEEGDLHDPLIMQQMQFFLGIFFKTFSRGIFHKALACPLSALDRCLTYREFS